MGSRRFSAPGQNPHAGPPSQKGKDALGLLAVFRVLPLAAVGLPAGILPHVLLAMSASAELTYSDVAEHSSKKVRFSLSPRAGDPGPIGQSQDLYVVIHDKIYNASDFVDEHPYVALFAFPLGGRDGGSALG
jgi:hypothetical protein